MSLMSLGSTLHYWAERGESRASVTDAQRTYSRGELDRWSNGIAKLLLDRGVRKGDIVSIIYPTPWPVPSSSR